MSLAHVPAVGRRLTPIQRAFVTEYIANGGDAPRAALVAGYAVATSAYDNLRLPHVQDAIHNELRTKLETEGASIAVRTLLELIKPEMPPKIRLDAAKAILDRGRFAPQGGAQSSNDPKALDEMSVDDLQKMVDDLKAQRASQATPVEQGGASSTPAVNAPSGTVIDLKPQANGQDTTP